MKLFNKKQIKKLEESGVVKHFNTAVHLQYIMNVKQADKEVIESVWSEVSKEGLLKWSCNTCALKNMKNVGNLYFKSKSEIGETSTEVEGLTETENNNTAQKANETTKNEKISNKTTNRGRGKGNKGKTKDKQQ